MPDFISNQRPFVLHQYKGLSISLPESWRYELEEGDQEACFDPKSQSTLRLHIIKAIPPKETSSEENIKTLTADNPYTITYREFLLTNPTHVEAVDNQEHITIITWRLINDTNYEKTMAIVTYTVLSSEKDTEYEKGVLNMIENSLKTCMLS